MRISTPFSRSVRASNGVGSARITGFTLVELLVVISIIGIMMGLLLPAVNAVRENARRMQCTNNLKQIGMGSIAHEKRHGHYPSHGWGYGWVGSPDRGYGADQTGGFFYSLLPFIEQGALHDRGTGESASEMKNTIMEVCDTAVPIYNCPSRRKAEAVRDVNTTTYKYAAKSGNTFSAGSFTAYSVARSDYATNAGGTHLYYGGAGPGAEAFKWNNKQWNNTYPLFNIEQSNSMDGISYFRSNIGQQDVLDGTSFTYLVGEKFICANQYFSGDAGGDNECMFCGMDVDVARFCNETDYRAQPFRDFPQIADGKDYGWRFGSAHASSFGMVFCDGSVHGIQYDIERKVHALMGNRRDGLPIPNTIKIK